MRAWPRSHLGLKQLGLCVTARALSAGWRRRAPPEGEIRDRHDPGGIDHRYHWSPQPLRAPDLVRGPALEVDESRPLEKALGNGHHDDQLAGAVAEIAPPSLRCHDILPTSLDAVIACTIPRP